MVIHGVVLLFLIFLFFIFIIVLFVFDFILVWFEVDLYFILFSLDFPLKIRRRCVSLGVVSSVVRLSSGCLAMACSCCLRWCEGAYRVLSTVGTERLFYFVCFLLCYLNV